MFQSKIVIGISGGTSCGKSSVADELCKFISSKCNDNVNIVKLSQDNSYKVLSNEDLYKAYHSQYNFDHPHAQDVEVFKSWISNIKSGNRVSIPVYDFVTHSHSKLKPDIVVGDCDILIVEGLFLFYDSELRDLFDYKIFIDVNDDERLSRRIQRDMRYRNRDINSILSEWRKFAQPGFKQFIFPTKEYADIIVPRGAQNKLAIEMIATHVIDMVRVNVPKIKSKL